MQSVYSLPPSDEVEMGDDKPRDEIPRSVSSLTSSGRSSMSVNHQSSAVADISGEIERQRQIAESERQQQDIIYSQQLELVRQNAESMLHAQAITQRRSTHSPRICK